jgi:hypothetical protein
MKGNSYMQRLISNLNNEEGSAIVIALIVLVMLTIIGTVSTSNTVFELQIVRNEAIYRRNFYRAESAIVEAAQRLEKSGSADLLPLTTTYNWLNNAVNNAVDTPAPDLAIMASWKDNADPPNWIDPPAWTDPAWTNPDPPWPATGASKSFASNNMDPADNRNNTRYAAICDGIAAGSSLSMTGGSNLYAYSVYGLFDSTADQGRSLIKMGYYKVF